MEISNVYVIYDERRFTKQDILINFRDEGYKHNFCFMEAQPKNDDYYKALKQADEVWILGDVDALFDYKVAKELGKDIWIMG